MLRWRHALALAAVVGGAGLAATAVLAAGPLNARPPVVTGDPVPGSTLTCDPGTWEDVIDGSAPLVAWIVNGVQVGGWGLSEELPLALTEADLGKRIACEAQASNIDGSAEARSGEVVVVRCTAATVGDLQDRLQTAQGERSAAAFRLAKAQTAYRKLLATQARDKRSYFAKVQSPARRKAFLGRQADARRVAAEAVTRAQNALDLAEQTLSSLRAKLAACG